MPDIFNYTGVDKMKKHTPEVKAFLKGRWITRKQFDKLGTDQLTKIGTWNKSKKHHPKTAVKGYDMSLKRKKVKKKNNYHVINKSMTDLPQDAPTLTDLPQDAIEKIGSFMNPIQQRRLGQAITTQTGRNYLLGQKHLVGDYASTMIQSFMRGPVITNARLRGEAVLGTSAYSVKPTGRSRAQLRDMKRRVDGFDDPGGRGVQLLRTRLGSVIDRGR